MGALQIPDMIWYDTAKRLTQRISAKLCTQSTWKQQHPLTCRSSWSEYTCTLFSSENQWSGQLLSKFWGLYNKQTNKTHTHTHRLNGPLSRTTRVSQYQKGKPNLDFTEARDSEWQWHQLGHTPVCTVLQTDNFHHNYLSQSLRGYSTRELISLLVSQKWQMRPEFNVTVS